MYNYQDIQTLTTQLISNQQQYHTASGDFTLLLSSIQTACKYIATKVTKAGISKLLGTVGNQQNASGEVQKKLDVISNEAFVDCLSTSHKVAVMVSEEEDHPVEVSLNQQGRYVLAFDPLDGSSNIDANVAIGSIFCIWKRVSPQDTKPTQEDVLQGGKDIVAAGYCLYSAATQLVLCTGGTVDCFTLDPSLGEFILTHPNIRIPKKGSIYSINEGYTKYWDPPITQYINHIKQPSADPEDKSLPKNLRYIGSMVADVHRTLLYGGIFLYPADSKSPEGKLRVLYESLPIGYIIEKAGGKAITGRGNVLDIKPKNIHQRCGFICGSIDDVEEVQSYYQQHQNV